jgi:hypothetical protein
MKSIPLLLHKLLSPAPFLHTPLLHTSTSMPTLRPRPRPLPTIQVLDEAIDPHQQIAYVKSWEVYAAYHLPRSNILVVHSGSSTLTTVRIPI